MPVESVDLQHDEKGPTTDMGTFNNSVHLDHCGLECSRIELLFHEEAFSVVVVESTVCG